MQKDTRPIKTSIFLLIVDSNIIISAAIARGFSLDFIFNTELELSTPDFAQVELEKHFEEIALKSGLNESELKLLFKTIFNKIRILPKEKYAHLKGKALQTSPDPNDWPYFALALAENDSIWSNDKKLKRQAAIRVLNTREVAGLF